MNDTTAKTSDNVVNRRRSTDWKRPMSVPHPDVFGWREGDGVAFIDDKAMARVTAALSGARAITAILMQHDLDRNDKDGRDNGLAFDEVTTHGLFEALASCLEVADMHTTGSRPHWTTSAMADEPEAKHMRRAAMDAEITMGNRQAVDHVERLNRCKTAKAAGKGAA